MDMVPLTDYFECNIVFHISVCCVRERMEKKQTFQWNSIGEILYTDKSIELTSWVNDKSRNNKQNKKKTGTYLLNDNVM